MTTPATVSADAAAQDAQVYAWPLNPPPPASADEFAEALKSWLTTDDGLRFLRRVFTPDRVADALELVFTPEQAAKVLRVGRTTVYGLLSSGALKSGTVGSLRRISLADLQDYIDTRLTQPACEERRG